MWCIQLASHHAFEQHALSRLDTFKGMTGFLGGVVIEAADSDTFCMQAFFRAGRSSGASDDKSLANLPDGSRHVFVHGLTLKAYGIEVE